MYNFYQINSEYTTDEMVLQLPVAVPSDSSSPGSTTVRLAKGLTKRIIRVAAERVGDWPRIPPGVDYQDAGGTAKFLKRTLDLGAPKLLAGATKPIFSIDATYEYAIADKPKTTDPLYSGSIPWDVSQLAGNRIRLSAIESTGIATT